jgi:hypothetical protein
MRADPMNDSRRCRAKSKATGKRCRKAAILGGTVCQKHGGGAPQVKAKAAERLLADEAVRESGLAARDSERVLAEIGCIAFAQVGDLYDGHGRILPLKQLPAHVQAAVAQQERTSFPSW